MSAYVVEKPTIERVVWAAGEVGQLSLFIEVLGKGDCNTIGRALWRMNVEAVMQRYPDCRENPADLPGPNDCSHVDIEQEEFVEEAVTLGQAYQSAGCLLYQCSEGDVPDWPLFAALVKLYDKLAHHLAGDHPDVQAAEWG